MFQLQELLNTSERRNAYAIFLSDMMEELTIKTKEALANGCDAVKKDIDRDKT